MIKLFVMDVDGTMTDGHFTLDSNGNETKTFNVKDGTAIMLLKQNNVKTAVITGRDSKIVKERCVKLGIDFYVISNDKLKTLDDIISRLKISYNDVAYIGDDLNDIEIFKVVRYKGCPSDACQEIKNMSNYICGVPGGGGAIREFAEKMLSLKNV